MSFCEVCGQGQNIDQLMSNKQASTHLQSETKYATQNQSQSYLLIPMSNDLKLLKYLIVFMTSFTNPVCVWGLISEVVEIFIPRNILSSKNDPQ